MVRSRTWSRGGAGLANGSIPLLLLSVGIGDSLHSPVYGGQQRPVSKYTLQSKQAVCPFLACFKDRPCKELKAGGGSS